MDVKFRLNKASYVILFVALAVIVLLILSPATWGISTPNPCGVCHGGRYAQYLDILEGNSAIPSAINIGETKTVSIVVENIVNTGVYSTLSSVSVTLSSQNGHFSINSPTYNVGDLPAGTKTASWQITGVSDGYDWLSIRAQATNPHFSVSFSDSYQPLPLIKVGNITGTPPPAPTSTPSPSLVPRPTPAPTTQPTPTPPSTSIPTPSPSTAFTPPPTNELSIQLTSPRDGEQWTAGTVQNVKWNVNGGTEPLTITLEYSTKGMDGPWTSIATGIPNNGSLTWKTPNTTFTVYIRAVVTDSANTSQTASTLRSIEIKGASATEFPLILIPAMLILAIAILAILIKRRPKGDRSGKISKTPGNPHVKSELKQPEVLKID